MCTKKYYWLREVAIGHRSMGYTGDWYMAFSPFQTTSWDVKNSFIQWTNYQLQLVWKIRAEWTEGPLCFAIANKLICKILSGRCRAVTVQSQQISAKWQVFDGKGLHPSTCEWQSPVPLSFFSSCSWLWGCEFFVATKISTSRTTTKATKATTTTTTNNKQRQTTNDKSTTNNSKYQQMENNKRQTTNSKQRQQ